ncbi:MAG: hypothetical protein C5B49_10615 [Bdellovibrio sp.]|nr:MAG: hypothetical protein C5B49_10615 [Bdellovibrio sp.]
MKNLLIATVMALPSLAYADVPQISIFERGRSTDCIRIDLTNVQSAESVRKVTFEIKDSKGPNARGGWGNGPMFDLVANYLISNETFTDLVPAALEFIPTSEMIAQKLILFCPVFSGATNGSSIRDLGDGRHGTLVVKPKFFDSVGDEIASVSASESIEIKVGYPALSILHFNPDTTLSDLVKR